MREVEYYYTNDCDLDMLMKKVADDEKDMYTGFLWSVAKDKWIEDWEITSEYFWGFRPATEISEEQAKQYIKNHQKKSDALK